MKDLIIEKLNFRKLFESIIESRPKHVLLVLHPNADTDSVCSNYNMLRILQRHDIKATLIGGDNFDPKRFGHLREFIKQIKNISYNEVTFSYDLLLVLDIPKTERISSTFHGLTGNEPFRTVVIDHHAGNNFVPNDKVEVFLDTTMSSTCEMLFRFASANNIALDEIGLKALFAGIWSDTMGFSINTTPWTHLCASEIRAHAEVGSIIMKLEKCWTPEDFVALAKIIPDYSISTIHKTSVGILVTESNELSFEKLQGFFQKEASKVVVTCVKYSYGFRIGVINWLDSKYAISKKIAEGFGGSGHANRAGAKEVIITDPVRMREQIVYVVKKVLSEI